LAKSFRSDIVVIGDDLKVDGKGIIGWMALAAGCVTILNIGAIGLDADDAVTAPADLLDAGFDDTADKGGDGTGG
jgi:phosphotransferase system HPr-like phosphotransfer protein